MDEETTIIDTKTRNEKIINFFIINKKSLIIAISIIVILLISYFSFSEIKKINKIKVAKEFNLTIIDYKSGKKNKTISSLTNIVNKKDITYSPLALYFILDNKLIEDMNEINNLFDVLIKETNLENEINNLIIYKKALYNSTYVNENELIQILNPIINSESIWKSHSLYLIAEYFYSKNEKQKAKEFFNQILTLPNSNSDIKLETQKRISRDLGE